MRQFKALIFLIALIMIISLFSPVQALIRFEGFEREITYGEYIEKYAEVPRPDGEIIIKGYEYSDTNMPVEILTDVGGISDRVVYTQEETDWADARPYIEWELEIEEAGLYNIEIEYYPPPGRTGTIQRDLWINGERPFQEARYLEFSRVWGDAYEFLTDDMGNEIRPRQIELPRWRRVTASDSLGHHVVPFEFYFEEGFNSLRFISLSEPMIIRQIRILQQEEVLDYEEIVREYEEKGYQETESFYLKVQGQEAAYRSEATLYPDFDRGDPTLMPYHPSQIRLNYIGGHRWMRVGQWITWEVEVPESGLYQIALKTKQNRQRGVLSHRILKINDVVPFQEVQTLAFDFSNYYDMRLLGTEFNEEPYLFYLEEGKNTITLEVVLGETAKIIRQIEEQLYNMNTIYRRIVMITSPTPDPLRDYQLHLRIPEIIESIAQQGEFFRDIARQMEEMTGEIGGERIELINSIARLMERMSDQPYRIPDVLPQYRDNIGALGTWLTLVNQQPLSIDYLVISSPGKEMPRATPNFWQTMQHEARSFIASFTFDYERVGNLSREDIAMIARTLGEDMDEEFFVEDQIEEIDEEDFERVDTITVWIGMGRDQAQSLKGIIEDSFTPATGISVDLQLISGMQYLLIPATIAGTAPDVAIGAANIDLAFRGAVYDLSEFADFDKVAERFYPSAFVPFRFRDQVFGLPETQNFAMLFFRTDILQELGLSVPRTWQDIYEVLPVLQRHNMDFGLQPNIGSMLMFLYQQGVSIYQPDMVAANLDSETAVRTFQDMAELYTLYSLPYQFDIQNRFRMGEMPIVIAAYGLFNQLQVFAPELRGEWNFTLIPGTRQPDGSIHHTSPVSGGGQPVLGMGGGAGDQSSIEGLGGARTTGTIIMDSSEKKEEAWEFLKWWTTAEVQARFGYELESLMGAAARYATANIEGLQMLPWNPEQRDELLAQWEWVDGVPPVPGGYYVSRQFSWLLRAVVLQNQSVRESVQDYVRAANREVVRKRAEFEFETRLEDIDERWIRLFWDQFTHINRLELPEYRGLR